MLTVISKNHDQCSILDSFAVRAEFSGSFYESNFSGSIMTYGTFGHYWLGYTSLQNSNFSKTNLRYSKSRYADFSNSNFTDANLNFADFENANLSNANFTNANLEQTTFRNSILIGSNLTQKQIESIKSIECTIMPDGNMNDKGC